MVTQQLNSGLLDFAVTVQNINTSAYNSLNLPYTDKWGVLMRKDNALANNPTINIQELSKLQIIVSRQGFSDEMPNE